MATDSIGIRDPGRAYCRVLHVLNWDGSLWKPGMLTWGEPAGLRRSLAEVMVPLVRGQPVAGPGAGQGPAGQPARRGRGWAAAAWPGRARRRILLPRRGRRTRPRRAGRR